MKVPAIVSVRFCTYNGKFDVDGWKDNWDISDVYKTDPGLKTMHDQIAKEFRGFKEELKRYAKTRGIKFAVMCNKINVGLYDLLKYAKL